MDVITQLLNMSTSIKKASTKGKKKKNDADSLPTLANIK